VAEEERPASDEDDKRDGEDKEEKKDKAVSIERELRTGQLLATVTLQGTAANSSTNFRHLCF